MILLVGQVPRAFRGREAWQELDYAQVFGGIAQSGLGGRQRRAHPRAHGRGVLAVALTGRPGPVVLALPEDVLAEEADVADGTARVELRSGRCRAALSSIGFASFSPRAERPLVVVGEGGWTAETSRDVQAFCEANVLPVACAFRCQDFVDNRSPSYVGVLGVAMDEAIAGSPSRRRPRARDRRSARRGADAPLHPPGTAGSAADARPRPSGRR